MRWYAGTPWLAAAAALAVLAGCDSDPIGGAPTPTPPVAAVPDAQPTLTKPPAAGAIGLATPTASSAAGPGGSPIANGRIVAVNATSMELEGERRPTVSWTPQTTFIEFFDAAASDLVVGTCALVHPSRMARRDGGPQEPQRDLQLTAAAVTISEAVDGTCAPTPGTLPGGPGDPPGDEAARPDGPGPQYWFEWRGPDHAGPGPSPGFNGLVTAIDGENFTIEIRRPWRDVGPSGSHQDPVTHRVTTNSETTWQRTATVAENAVQVGKCATAMGRPIDRSYVEADSITLRPAKDGRCLFEGPRGFGPRPDGEGRGPGLSRGPDEPQRPSLRRASEDHRPASRPDRRRGDAARRHDRREREHDRPEPVSGGSGAGGGAAGTQLR